MVIDALDTINPLKSIEKNNKILRPQLVATLGFFHHLDFSSAKERFKGVKVDELTVRIVNKCTLMLPDICKSCTKIYQPDMLDAEAACFICTKGMCPACCPIANNSDGFLSTLFPVCSSCCEKHRHKSGVESQNSDKDEIPDDFFSQETPISSPVSKKRKRDNETPPIVNYSTPPIET